MLTWSAWVQALQQRMQVGGEGVVVIPAGRLAGLAEPAPVIGDDPVPGGQQGRDLLVPGPAAERVAVDQHDGLAGAVIFVVVPMPALFSWPAVTMGMRGFLLLAGDARRPRRRAR